MNRQQTQKNKNIEDEIWEIVRVIPIAEEKIPCCIKECSKDAAFSWASNSNRNDIWNFCEGCQVIERGGWPNGVVPIKYLADEDGNRITIMSTLKLKQHQRPPVKKRVLRRPPRRRKHWLRLLLMRSTSLLLPC